MGKSQYTDKVLEERRRKITSLVKAYYEQFDFLQYDPLDLLINKSLDLFLESDLSLKEIDAKLVEAVAVRKKALDDRYDSEKVKANHETIYGRLEQLARGLNQEGVDYQLAGALCGYIKYGEESNRCHDDIDICLNEEDMDQFRRVCLHMGLFFEDHRADSPRILKNGIPSGEHEVIARDPNSDFHIGVFPFERAEKGVVISKGYYHDEDGNPWVREEIYAPELAREVYGSEEVDFRGTPIVITPPEHIYRMKSYTKNEKDQKDVAFLKDRMDWEKYERMDALRKDGFVVEHVPVYDIPHVLHNSYNDEEDDLGLMLADDDPVKKEEKSSGKKEGTKMLVKEKQQEQEQQQEQTQEQQSISEEGFISNTIITTLALITFVLCFIGVAVIYLIQM